MAGGIGRPEKRLHFGKLRRQHGSDFFYIPLTWRMAGPQLHENLPVGRTDRGGFHPSLVDGNGRANVLHHKLQILGRDDLPDLALNVRNRQRCVVNSHTAGNTHKQPDQPGVGLREKLATRPHHRENPQRHS